MGDRFVRSRRVAHAIVRALSLVAVVVGLGAANAGCGLQLPWGDYDDGSDSALGRHSEAVVVDYYKGKKKLRSCAGTLLSSNVVIAPAHCAEGSTKAVVGALDKKRTRTSVARVYTYDWVQGDPSVSSANRHDVSLLVTRKAIDKVRYAKVQSKPCKGCKVLSIGRSRDGKSRVLSISKKLGFRTTDETASAPRVALPETRTSKRGGAVYRLTKENERVIVGLVVGRAKKSGTTVVVPLTNPLMHKWIRAVVKTERAIVRSRAKASSKRTVSTSGLRFQSEEMEESAPAEETPAEPAAEETPAEEPSNDPADSAPETESEPVEEKVDDESAENEPTADPAPTPDRESEPTTEEDPVTEEPTATERESETTPEETPTEDPRAETPRDETPSDDRPREETPSEETPTLDDNDPVVPTGERETEDKVADPPADPAKAAAEIEEKTPTTSDASGFEDNQRDPRATEDTARDSGPLTADGNETTPKAKGTLKGVAPLRAPADDQKTVLHPTGNAVTVAKDHGKDVEVFKDDAVLAERYKDRANIFNSHGFPGTLVGGVPRETVERFLKDDKPLIVASCFSAAPTAGGSTIRRMANTYSDDPAAAGRIYGCSGFAFGTAENGLECSGAWLDGNGRAVPKTERERLGLKQFRCQVNTVTDDRTREIMKDCTPND